MQDQGNPIVIVPYAVEWPERFRELAGGIRRALGDVALRIDHIGSTSIAGLAAKPIIDIQVSVASFEPFAQLRDPLERIGYIWRAANTDLTKRYFRESPGSLRTHVHVRIQGSWSEQFALLFRDYVRAHPEVAEQYAAVKRDLADQYRDDRHGYTEAKEPFIWEAMRQASNWSQEVGWKPGPPDA
jgi:GrpB-like predicted nucleotidyltransferase (UPF0157 family)